MQMAKFYLVCRFLRDYLVQVKSTFRTAKITSVRLSIMVSLIVSSFLFRVLDDNDAKD